MVACAMLAAATLPWAGARPGWAACILIYAAALVAMLACSAGYNLAPAGTARKALLRRFDRAAIFAMIAGTSTPLVGIIGDGPLRIGVLAGVWAAAVAGAAQALIGGRQRESTAVLLYLLLGWCGAVLIIPLAQVLPAGALVLLLAGGVLYTAGAAFHLASGLRYHNAAWHAFVLAAAISHFTVILNVIAIMGRTD